MATVFGRSKSAPYSDPLIGELRRKRGMWRGVIDVGGTSVALAVPGSRSGPDERALEVARSVPSGYPGWRTVIEVAMFDHYAPYAASAADDDDVDNDVDNDVDSGGVEGLWDIERPDQVWSHLVVDYVAIITVDHEHAVEIGYRAAWDDDHVLGARLRDGRLLELNGSVLSP